MSSKTKKIIEIQKGFYEAEFQKRQADLKTINLEDAKISKDPQLRHLRAKVRQANRRLIAISKIQKQIEASASRKREKASEERIERKSRKKSAPQPTKKKAKEEETTAA